MRVVHLGDWSPISHQLFGKVLDKFSGNQIDTKWLEIISYISTTLSSAVERQQFSRAFILRLTGGHLIPDKSRNLVHLPLQLINLKETGRLSCGSTILTTLYRKMCPGTEA
ncbi:hypothetical protein Goklo_028347 [Gossypium klotzschianum]|nr:hypothetical protein [Gossypium klotzschianum]